MWSGHAGSRSRIAVRSAAIAATISWSAANAASLRAMISSREKSQSPSFCASLCPRASARDSWRSTACSIARAIGGSRLTAVSASRRIIVQSRLADRGRGSGLTSSWLIVGPCIRMRPRARDGWLRPGHVLAWPNQRAYVGQDLLEIN